MRTREYIYFIVISMCIDAIDFNSNRLTIVHTLKHAKWILEWYQYRLVTWRVDNPAETKEETNKKMKPKANDKPK